MKEHDGNLFTFGIEEGNSIKLLLPKRVQTELLPESDSELCGVGGANYISNLMSCIPGTNS